MIIYFVIEKYTLDLVLYRNIKSNHHGLVSSLKNLNLNLSDLEEILAEHSIASVTDEQGTIVYANKKFCEISKYPQEELLGQNHRILKSDEHNSDFFTDMWEKITSGNIWVGEIKNRAKDGTFYWLKTTIIPVKDSQGRIKYFVAIRTDVTKEKQMYEKLLQVEQELIQQNLSLAAKVATKSSEIVKNERLATIGTMASRIAHDLKNPLTILHTYADMLTPEILSKLDSKDKEKWFRLQNSIFDMHRIVDDVLDFARTSELNKKKTSFMRILRLSLNNVRSTYGIVIKLPENDITLNCDPRKIEGVMSNLINNAVHALDGQGEIEITLSSDSNNIIIQVKDSGPGIPDENMEKIFEPMFTTKNTGTGLGLVICKSIIEQHGGTISVDNNPTTFTIKLPA